MTRPAACPPTAAQVAVGVQLVRRHHAGRLPRRSAPASPHPSAPPVRVRPPSPPTLTVRALVGGALVLALAPTPALLVWTTGQARAADRLLLAQVAV